MEQSGYPKKLKGIDYIDFDLTSNPVHLEGRIHWDDNDKTLELDTEIVGTHIQIGQETVLRATNKTGVSITNGSVVYINGAQGNRPTIALADADTEATSSKVIGVVTDDIDNNATGYVTAHGLIRGLNTNAFNEGDILWLSETAGQFTNVRPDAPAHAVYIGLVVTKHATEGVIFVRPNNGFEIGELHDVKITSVADKNILQYDSNLLYFKNVTPDAFLATGNHHSLLGLTDDDHTQYALLAGRATPQQIAFGNASGASTGYLTSTSHSTKGKYFLNAAGTITIDEANLRIGLGTAAPDFAIHSVATTNNQFAFDIFSNSAVPAMYFRRGRASQTAIANGQNLGEMSCFGWDGSAFQQACRIVGVSSNVSGSVVGGNWIFYTTDAAGTSAERVRLDKDGYFSINNGTVSTRLSLNEASSAAIFSLQRGGTTRAQIYGDLSGTTGGKLSIYTKLDGSASITEKITVLHDGKVGFNAATPTNDLSFGGNSARIIWLERHTTSNTAGNTLTIQAGGATSGATDKNGGALILQPGLSTGTGMGSVRIKRLTRAASTSTSDNSIVDAHIIAAEVHIASETSVNLFEVSLPAGSAAGGLITYQIVATDGTDYMVHSGHGNYAVANKGGTYTTQFTDESATEDANVTTVLGGGISETWAITSGTNKVTISVSVACTNMVANDIRIYYTLHNGSTQAITQL